MAIMSLYTSGRDPENFSQPQNVAPERWLRNNNKSESKTYKPHGSMPFAIGARSCVGKKIANYKIHCLITKVTINFIENCKISTKKLFSQLLQQFTLKSLNTDEVNFKLELVGVPDRKILIAFQNLILWKKKRRKLCLSYHKTKRPYIQLRAFYLDSRRISIKKFRLVKKLFHYKTSEFFFPMHICLLIHFSEDREN